MCGIFGGFSSNKSKTKEKSQQDPWDVAIPYIDSFLKQRVGPQISQPAGPTAGMTTAYNQLKSQLSTPNPHADAADALAGDLFNVRSRSPEVERAYAAYENRMTPVADGKNLDIESNPYIQAMLQKNMGDAVTRANELFAGSGRSFSGAHMGEIGRSVSEAQLPVLSNLYQYEQGRTDQAKRDLYSGATSAATNAQNLDQMAAQLRAMGIDVGNAAQSMRTANPQQLLELEQYMRLLPYDEMSKLASILFGAGQLGQQSEGTSKTKSSGFKLGFDTQVAKK